MDLIEQPAVINASAHTLQVPNRLSRSLTVLQVA
jgi:hypothetical protein